MRRGCDPAVFEYVVNELANERQLLFLTQIADALLYREFIVHGKYPFLSLRNITQNDAQPGISVRPASFFQNKSECVPVLESVRTS